MFGANLLSCSLEFAFAYRFNHLLNPFCMSGMRARFSGFKESRAGQHFVANTEIPHVHRNVWMIQLLDWPWGKNKLRRSQLPVLVSSLVYLFRLHLSVYHHLPLRFSVSICFSLVADQSAANHKGRSQPECPCWDRNRNDLARCPDFFRTVIIGGGILVWLRGSYEISGKYLEVTSL